VHNYYRRVLTVLSPANRQDASIRELTDYLTRGQPEETETGGYVPYN
jgi:hypothetical protein